MPVLKEEFTYQSVVGDADIHAISWKPEGPVKAVLQLVHGMAEYIDRYDGMARWFAERGIAVYGNDHLGHGPSVPRTKTPLCLSTMSMASPTSPNSRTRVSRSSCSAIPWVPSSQDFTLQSTAQS